MMERRMRLGRIAGDGGWGEEERERWRERRGWKRGGYNPEDWSRVALAGEGNSVSL